MTQTLTDILAQQVRDARERLAEAEAKYEKARQSQYEERLRQKVSDALADDGSLFYDPEPCYRGEAPYILPLGRNYGKCNPLKPDTFPFGGSDWLKGDSVFVLERLDKSRNGPSRIVIGSGYGYASWRIGNEWTCRHDQTGAKLGEYRVVGIVVYDEQGQVARVEGNVPDKALSAAVFK